MSSYLQALYIGIRTKTLIASISPVLIGSAIAIRLHKFNPMIAFCTLICALSIQILTNLANDYFDHKKGADTPARVGPQRVMQMGLMTSAVMIKTMIGFCALAIISAIPLILTKGAFITELLILALILAYLYTATPFALAYNGLADIVVFFFFGPVAVFITQLLQTNSLQITSTLGYGTGAMSAALLTLNNLRDYHQDKACGKKTLVVRFGLKFGKAQIILYTIIVLFHFAPFLKDPRYALLLPFLGLIPLIRFLRVNTSEGYASYFPKLTLLFWTYSIIFCTCLIVL
jgi:1,4-dihydroxy-2-naphthoate polyprenyltransferase